MNTSLNSENFMAISTSDHKVAYWRVNTDSNVLKTIGYAIIMKG